MRLAGAVTTHVVDFDAEGARRARRAPVGRLPRVVRMLALAYKIDAMICNGELRDLATAARVMGLTRARVTQVMNLLLLAPSIQEEILDLSPVNAGRDPVSERALRRIVAEVDWNAQMEMWRCLT